MNLTTGRIDLFSSGMPRPRAAGFVTVFAEDRTADLWLKRNRVVLAAIITDDLKPRRCVDTLRCLLRPASRTALRSHHIALVKSLLILFGKDKYVSTLNTRNFNIRHIVTSWPQFDS